MTKVLSILGALAALALFGVSAFMNYKYASTNWGNTPENSMIWGIASIAFDVLKALLPFFIIWAWVSLSSTSRIIFVMVAAPTFAGLVAFSLGSALGFANSSRGETIGKKQNITAEFQEIKSDIEKEKEKRDSQPQARALSIIAQKIKAKELNRRFTTSDACTNATATKSRDFCKDYFDLTAERAAAKTRASHEIKITSLKARRDTLRAQGATFEADAQAGLLSKLTGLKIKDTQDALIVFVSVLIEVIAAFGLYLATAHGAFYNRVKTVKRKVSNDNKKTHPKETTKDYSMVLAKERFAMTLA